MNGNYFLDTNILVYSFDSTFPAKQAEALRLIKNALHGGKGVISSQVVQEFINVATKKFDVPFSLQDCRKYLDTVLAGLCRVFSSLDLYKQALDIMERWGYSHYDSLIIAAALQADCEVLYSEELHHHQKIQGLTIIDPFRK
ncbi:VapC toxin family PIN domain ribonuclease [Prosthecochloris marina]|uniref:VapC toxin family PIN domain ribonuclease n=1 Tax=Prosthecochloris marina TaxID=2017681 RepID=A0A317T789_9CHLB|nr:MULTISPECIES: PIN domain-containing protein [Prosthecochloris]PWW82504.1 VapC toxin family PIN domain ribonuclease [Prosthecochloris marina]UZJ39326.1 PIN domain-containing protein [Prosthecochloris sp. SCSIO W1102]